MYQNARLLDPRHRKDDAHKPWPLVIFSHGLGGTRSNYRWFSFASLSKLIYPCTSVTATFALALQDKAEWYWLWNTVMVPDLLSSRARHHQAPRMSDQQTPRCT